MRNFFRISTVSAVMVALAVARTAQATVVYDNSTTDLGINFNPGSLEVGDEITLGGSDRFVTNFVFQYYLLNPNGNEKVQLRIYANDGALDIDGTHKPLSVLFTDGPFAIGGTSRSTLVFDQTELGGGFYAPDELTWSVEFTGLGDGDEAGVSLYSPPTVGTGYYDYWVNNAGTWTLMTNNLNPIDFGAQIEATPEPSSFLLVGLAGIVGMVAKRRLLPRK